MNLKSMQIKITHIALWCKDLDTMKAFYETFFGCISSEMYHNSKNQFTSYFLDFSSGIRLELMSSPLHVVSFPAERLGWAHLALSVGSEDAVIDMIETLRCAGVTIAGEPRTTGDGYFESVIVDPEGNQIEITI
ncbi:MAG: lactoylglutathione lyase [Cyclobacteriaceae bacterium]|jgi:lactoylglutathione lyase